MFLNETQRLALPRLAGFIPYHPDGEISVWDFMTRPRSYESARHCVHSNGIQTPINTVLAYVFLRNTWRALCLLHTRKQSWANWSCFIQALVGVITACVNLSSIFPGGTSCRINLWVCSFGITVSAICVDICLLVKAYAAQNRDRRLIWVCGLLMAPQLAVIWIVWVESIMLNTEKAACIFLFPAYLPWFRFGLDVAINLLFSAVFLYAVYSQYTRLGRKCWRKLGEGGVVFLFAVVLSNLVCALITATGLFGPLSEMFFLIDWVVTSTLLVRQHESIRSAFVSSQQEITRAQVCTKRQTFKRMQ
ncbi:hypothetical protein THASP1DRAFT_28546 [Thamnocephalis sphaerospora]|uniref:Uncharacterized protein n=1 Tax=Thamnocephalis sphaerospora TaxID=78915 RepID=A0A4P9XUM3_9FUNG|nr:hypothetical protein THASP1DRAFT_28546 [Thamnocephalis sphaerospora]|eukprot:RKP09662.1 hypothetical protein THASP1DRAFT_28546 [Thamnocephalis sphaerospora]